MGGSRGGQGAGGLDPLPEKSQKYRVFEKYWSRSPENSERYQASIKCLVIINTPAKWRFAGVSIMARL